MLNRVKRVGYFVVCWAFATTVYAMNMTPLGEWKTVDDRTGKVRSILSIQKASNHTLSGKLVKIYPDAGQPENGLCTACKGADHNKPLVGLTIMWGLSPSKNNEWKGGRIMDPKTGKVYQVAMMVMGGGDKMKVHGYIGLPLLGRTQIWERVDAQK